jgi:hypothetical protein
MLLRLIGLISLTLIAGAVGIAAAQSPLEPRTSSGGIPWVSGGVGMDETLALQQMQGDYNLRLLFAVQGSGEYLADIAVIVQSKDGRSILEATAQGPRLLAQVPPGAYTVTAVSGGATQTRHLTVPRTGAVDQAFYFPPN